MLSFKIKLSKIDCKMGYALFTALLLVVIKRESKDNFANTGKM